MTSAPTDFTLLEALSKAHPSWLRASDLGGYNNSNHTGMLTRLAREGLVEFRQRRPLAHKQYRVTDKGRALVMENAG